MKIKLIESKTAFRNINGVNISDKEWKENICRKCCEELVADVKKLNLKPKIFNKDGKEIKNHAFLKLFVI